MFVKHCCLLSLLTTVLALNNHLPSGNFGHFGTCVIKFLRLSYTFEYIDLTEHLIHVNNPASLIYTVHGRLNSSDRWTQNEKKVQDFKFYEACTLTIFVKFDIEDNEFRSDYLLFTRDAHRSWKHSVFILIYHLAPKKIMWYGYTFEFRVPYRIFVVHLKRSVTSVSTLFYPPEIEWFFICVFCKQKYIELSYTEKIAEVSVTTFRTYGWRKNVSIAAVLPQKFKSGRICGKGQYHIAPGRNGCDLNEIEYLTIGNILNISFLVVPFPDWQTHLWGYFEQNIKFEGYAYGTINQLYSFRYDGYHGIYCNFNVWSENSDLAAWVSAFSPVVWLCCAVIVLMVVMQRSLRDLFKPQGSFWKLNLIKDAVEVILAILAIHVRQTPSPKRVSLWILVSFQFTSFMLIAQYELYLTGNLVMPPRYEKLRTLSEFFANDYTVVYPSEEADGMISTSTDLQKEFVRKSLRSVPYDKTIVIRYVRLMNNLYKAF